jgi:glycosyltransferase 2 family protein
MRGDLEDQPSAHPERAAVPDPEQAPATYQRSPVDILRLAVAAAAFLLCLGLAVGAENTMVGVEADLLLLLDRVPSPLAVFLVGLVQLVALAAPPVLIAVALVLRRFRLALLLVAVPVAAAVLEELVAWRLGRLRPPLLERALAQESWIARAGFPGTGWICGAAAGAIVASPWLTRGMRRAAWWLVGAFAVTRMVTGHELPQDVLAAIALGALAGSAGLLLAGRPSLRPTGPQLRGALARSGLEVKSLERAGVDARGSTPYFARLTDGRRLFVKALGQDERDADLLFRAWRRLRLQNVGDELPYSTLRRAVEHEALVSLKATDAGVRTPHLAAVAAVGELAMVLAYDAVDGRSLDQVDAGDLTDDVLRGIWEQVAELRRQRIAHRDLRLANVFLDPDGRPWLIDFGFAELAATDAMLDEDAAELLCSTYTKVPAERAVAAAVEVLGPGPVAAALRYVQPAALSSATRKAVDALPGREKPLQAEVLRATGSPEPEYVQVERVSLRRVAVWLFTGVAVYFLIHQLSDVQLLAQQVRHVDWRWLPAILALSVLSYAAAAMSAVGSVPDRLPPWPTFVAQVGASFVNWVTPAKVGGLALGARFMERQGVHAAVAVTGAGINAAAGAVMHVALLAIFAVAVGAGGLDGVHPPSPRILLAVGVGILAVSGLVAAVPAGRRLVYRHVVPSLGRAVHGMRELGGQPGKLVLLFGGSALVTLCYAFALVACVEAFGGGLPVAAIIAAYLVGAAIAQVAPTPGGIGAVEAALIAGLTAAGLDKETAVPAVFLFRLATFWLPILPGWLAFTWLQRSDRI